MTVLSSIPNSVYVYLIIIVLLLITDIVLTVLSIKTRKRVKIRKDFLEAEKQEKETPVNDEILAIFNKMEEDSKLKPEEVVQKFEDEQEQNAIISYQELVNSVKNNEVEVIEEDNGDIDFVKQLELELDVEPVNKAEKANKIEEVEPTLNSQEDSVPSHLDVVDELNNKHNKFTTSEVISPVFGRITDFTNYSLNKENTVEIKQVAGNSTEEEIKKNEAFLKALVEFRNNL